MERKATMQLQSIRPNIVQAIRAYRVSDLMQAAADAGQHFLYANLSQAQSDVFRDAADFWGERRIPFRCFYSFL